MPDVDGVGLTEMNLAPSLHEENECKETERGATLQNHQPAVTKS
jgi:hypothetical protein